MSQARVSARCTASQQSADTELGSEERLFIGVVPPRRTGASVQGLELSDGLQGRVFMGNVWGRVSGEGGCHWLEAHEVMLTEVTYGATLSSPTEVCSMSGHLECEKYLYFLW